MITNHSASVFNFARHAMYWMPEFEDVKHSKKHDCYYSIGNGANFKRIFIDNELSRGFRYEGWQGEKYYCVTLLVINISVGTKIHRCLPLTITVTVLENNEYNEYVATIHDERYPVSAKLTQGNILEYAKKAFDDYKDSIIYIVSNGVVGNPYNPHITFSEGALHNQRLV